MQECSVASVCGKDSKWKCLCFCYRSPLEVRTWHPNLVSIKAHWHSTIEILTSSNSSFLCIWHCLHPSKNGFCDFYLLKSFFSAVGLSLPTSWPMQAHLLSRWLALVGSALESYSQKFRQCSSSQSQPHRYPPLFYMLMECPGCSCWKGYWCKSFAFLLPQIPQLLE